MREEFIKAYFSSNYFPILINRLEASDEIDDGAAVGIANIGELRPKVFHHERCGWVVFQNPDDEGT